MIEHALVADAKIRWQKPATVAQQQNGAIVQSVSGASAMRYNGTNQQQRRGLFRRPARVYQMPLNSPIPHTWLDYIPGRTAYVGQGTDVLTGFMSGCLIARGTYQGGMKVFHMGTVENQVINNQVKATFRAALPNDATGFYPADAWTVAERAATNKATDIIALVTSGGGFYSILLCHDGPGEYFVGGIKKVPPIHRPALLVRLA
ncbi:MAG: hypothetical protein B6D70_09965 [gamma proteobacterium symbiont of Stewartia floridana]|uniref:Uncharacterized protein n=1 Tax=Candidatus Thiodiazotropha taylori TaxID=2792791 RepID=A0A9E4N323_9GAMM|nr:hypothetical protein [Candidatus Thiodiazotropha taylori]MCG8016676.1 hypothetical protein [Candidatus Thiodiazotropha sp. 'RUGA']RLW55430.1 MAG: hypothetical protein B6D76_03775 [gamma proteobacterium symbiont of Stewartia floridana]MCG7896243.1 hypothetical protein [Candidatus Thiodiazotropha taylori]MCG7908490.1 hypothetical protein [Candidatus Thiodiazotropha taylori]